MRRANCKKLMTGHFKGCIHFHMVSPAKFQYLENGGQNYAELSEISSYFSPFCTNGKKRFLNALNIKCFNFKPWSICNDVFKL